MKKRFLDTFIRSATLANNWIFALALTHELVILLSFDIESFYVIRLSRNRSSRPEVLFGKRVLKICSEFTGEHPCQSAISHERSPVDSLHIFRTTFPKNTSGLLLLKKSFE